jgi:glycine betaine/proline transport system permease protein
MTVHWGAVFDGITITVRLVLDFIERVGLAMPWPAVTLLVSLLAWRTGGVPSAVFAVVILGFLGFFGYWEKSISTMSLVMASVLICIVFGVPIGILCAKYPRMNRIANPVMDMMQTMPSMVYLLPAIAFFSIGKPPAVLATVVFAMPPVIKLTALGIRQIPENVKEAMLAFGASPLQLLIKAELPMSISSIMTGINQSIMMSLSMVVIAALIGAEGLGRDVLAALQQMDNGSGILAGIAILLCAMLLDSIVQGSNTKR